MRLLCRADEAVVVGGEWVVPEVVEGVVREVEGVRERVMVTTGEGVRVLVVLEEGVEVDKVREEVSRRLEEVEVVIEEMVVVEGMLRSPLGKGMYA